ncbi:MAG: hypothetical protein FJ267_07425 [Planctomycetes bacterium]|nr:hypothetical protein [Planctomycetota bacterium]
MLRLIRHGLADRPLFLNIWALTAAFSTYFFMYMFRKPFTAAAFAVDAETTWDGKSVIVASQIIGYFCSKLIGIQVISQMPAKRRASALFFLILLSHFALLLFAVLPAPWHIVAIFLNGLPLGMVFGLVLGFLEGRRLTEALVAGLCGSFIIAGGYSKTIGQWTLDVLTESLSLSLASAERWMPFITASFFLVPIGVSVWMLAQIPPPSELDEQLRSERSPMTNSDRWRMLKRYGIGMIGVAAFYLVTTILRSLRDDFAPQILSGMGATIRASDYAWIDTQVAVVVLAVSGATALIRNNRLALQLSLAISLLGFALLAVALTASDWLSPVQFMVMIGAGLYLPYLAVHTTVFERLIALTRDRGNMGYLMYVVDSIGYLGYIVILFLPKDVLLGDLSADTQFYSSFRGYVWVGSTLGCLMTLVAMAHFSFMRSDPYRKA